MVTCGFCDQEAFGSIEGWTVIRGVVVCPVDNDDDTRKILNEAIHIIRHGDGFKCVTHSLRIMSDQQLMEHMELDIAERLSDKTLFSQIVKLKPREVLAIGKNSTGRWTMILGETKKFGLKSEHRS